MIATAGSIGSLTLGGDLTGGEIMAGDDLGSDGAPGGTGSAADTYATATIGKLTVKGAATSAVVAAGADPRDATFGNANDRAVDAASRIGLIVVRGGADQATRFEAASFGRANLPQLVDPASDPRFKVLT
jgi:hypothetical protein